MNASTAAVLSCFALGVGGVSAYLAFAPSQDASVRAADTAVVRAGSASDLEASVRALQESVADLERQIAVVQAGPRSSSQVSQDDLQRAIAAYLENAGDEAVLADPADLSAPEAATAEDLVAQLMEAGTIEATELWKKIVDEGMEDEVLALYKAAAEADPNDPEAQLALGEAYLGLTQQHAGSAAAGQYATLADAALDQALVADPQHWDARYTKAVALSFWPPVFGKQSAAIQQFETLVEQQAGMTPTDRHSSTHLLLGNMYQQTGQMDKALEAWRAGLAIFPDDSDLAAQIALASGGGGGGY